MNKTILSVIFIISIFAIGAVFLSSNKISKQNTSTENEANNVTQADGKQIILLTAKGGYSPRVSEAKAGVPTILRVNTDGTFDCSATIRIPALGISEFLPNSGTKDINLGVQKVGKLKGTCGMGMYPFEINFQS